MGGLLALLTPTTVLALVAAFGAGYVGGHWEGSAGASARCEARQLQAANQILTNRFDALSAAAEAHTQRLAADTAADNDNRSRVDATPENPAACLPRDAVGRVRAVR